jgi:hypothetical protein
LSANGSGFNESAIPLSLTRLRPQKTTSDLLKAF